MYIDTAVDIVGTATITVTASFSEGGFTNSESASFDIELLSPCADDSFMIIQTSALPTINYNPLSSSTAASPLIWPQATVFTLQTLPFQHNMCGDLSYDGGSDTVPEVQYDPLASEYSLHVDDAVRDYDGTTQKYYLEAYLAQYPTLRQRGEGDLVFSNPCDTSSNLVLTPQTMPYPEFNWLEPLVLDMNDYFSADLGFCDISYDCLSISYTDEFGVQQPTLLTCQSGNFQLDLGPNGLSTVEFYANPGTEQCDFPPGTYTCTFEATVFNNLDANHPKTQDVSFVIADPCTPEVLSQFEIVLN